MKTSIRVFLIAFMLGASATPSADEYSSPEEEINSKSYEIYDIVLPGIAMRPEVSADVNVRVTANMHKSCIKSRGHSSRTFAVIHGITHTAATWEPFTEALMKHSPNGRPACNVLAIDLPGHGRSSLPTNVFYGDLSFEDYVESVKGTLAKLNAIGYRTPNLIGFSHAGYMLQLVQQSLLNEGTSLRQAYDVKNTLFFASSLPTPLDWSFADSGAGAEFITQFYRFDPVLGTHVDIPDDIWPSLWFVNAAGVLVSGAPSPETVTAKGYNNPESSVIVSQLLAVPPYVRPSVRAGVFSEHYGTQLNLITYSNDIFISPQESKSLYQHLTDDPSHSGYILIENEEAVHDFHISEPEKLLRALRGKVHL